MWLISQPIKIPIRVKKQATFADPRSASSAEPFIHRQ